MKMPWSYDEWGCKFVRLNKIDMGQIKGHPLREWSQLKKYKFPDANGPKLYEGMEDRFIDSDGKYILTGIFMFLFERLHALRGFENVLLDLLINQEKISNLADRIVEFNIAIIDNIASRFPGRIHGIHVTDDWGTETASFISPALFKEFFEPRYRRIIDVAKGYNWHFWLHTCGKVDGLIDSFIDLGIDVLNMQQPLVMGIENLGERFGGRVCFAGTCDIQHSLPVKTLPEIETEVKLIVEKLGTDDGGLFVMEYGDGISIGVARERLEFMLQAFLEHDRWKR
jgi:hypothetical protein